MALDAIHLDVHPAQGITRLLVVVEFRDCADRLPTRLRMTILARNGKRAMGAASLRIGRTTVLSKADTLDKDQQERERQQYPLDHECQRYEPVFRRLSCWEASVQFINPAQGATTVL